MRRTWRTLRVCLSRGLFECSYFVLIESSDSRQGRIKILWFGSAKNRRGFDRSGDDVGRDLVFDEGDAVAQLQLAFLQPLQPQKIGCGRLMQRIDRRVEIAMLLLQPRQFSMQLALIFVGHDAT